MFFHTAIYTICIHVDAIVLAHINIYFNQNLVKSSHQIFCPRIKYVLLSGKYSRLHWQNESSEKALVGGKGHC